MSTVKVPGLGRTEAGARRARNKEWVRHLAAEAPTDLEALAQLFDGDGLVDDGTVCGRLRAVLEATDRRTVPGLHTAITFGDTGFAGDQKLDGAGFRDPWPSSRNQVGHFLTALRMQTDPAVVNVPLPLLGSVRRVVAAPRGMSDREVALRLSIGHEKMADPPNGLAALMLALEAGLGGYRRAVAAEATSGLAGRAFAAAFALEAWRQFWGSLATFRTQFHATTAADVAAWQEALRTCCHGLTIDRRALESPGCPLQRIAVANGEGNSRQDLRLTFVGWRLGQLIGEGAFPDRHAVAAWLRRTLG